MAGGRAVTWAKMDDGFDEHPKVEALLERDELQALAAIGLWTLTLTSSSRRLTDGQISARNLRRLAPEHGERLAALLTEHGLFDDDPDGLRIHDYLHYNPSRKQIERRRKKDRVRKDSARNPHGIQKDSSRSPDGIHGDSRAPARAPGRRVGSGRGMGSSSGSKDQTETSVARARERGFDDFLAYHRQTTGHTPPREGTAALRDLAEQFNGRLDEGYSLDDLKAAVDGAWGDEYRREKGYTTADSVLRPTKVAALIERGRRPQSVGSTLSRKARGNLAVLRALEVE
jgi:hypothetical protein